MIGRAREARSKDMAEGRGAHAMKKGSKMAIAAMRMNKQ